MLNYINLLFITLNYLIVLMYPNIFFFYFRVKNSSCPLKFFCVFFMLIYFVFVIFKAPFLLIRKQRIQPCQHLVRKFRGQALKLAAMSCCKFKHPWLVTAYKADALCASDGNGKPISFEKSSTYGDGANNG